jgi:putative membrane protein
VWLWLGWGFRGGWLQAKLGLVLLLLAHHFWLGQLVRDFARDANKRTDIFYRWINEIPLLYLVAIVILVVVKPF